MPASLERFIEAQDAVYDQVRRELAAGRKASHWMWFVFPQLAGLGRSETARFYALNGMEEARDYLAHPVLGPRLRDAVTLVLASGQSNARAVFGSPDDLKFCSCLTLFLAAAEAPADRNLFASALTRFFAGQADPLTTRLLNQSPPPPV